MNIIICWELGGGFGHIMRAAALARQLSARKVVTTVALRDLSDSTLADWPSDSRILQAPISLNKPQNFKSPANYTEILYSNGYHSPRVLDALATAWMGLLEMAEPNVIIADHAPTAILCGKVLGIPTISLGTGFFAPPDASTYPIFRTWEPIDHARLQAIETHVLHTINGVVHGAEIQFTSLADALRPDINLIASWPELDHYAGQRNNQAVVYAGNETALGKSGLTYTWKNTSGKRLLAYLKKDYPAFSEVIKALQESEAEVVAYISGLAPEETEKYQTENVTICQQMIALGKILENCDGVICHAGAGTVALCLDQGVPVFMLPYTVEQFIYAKKVVEHGFGMMQTDLEAKNSFSSQLLAFQNEQSFHGKISAAKLRNQHLPADATAYTAEQCLKLA